MYSFAIYRKFLAMQNECHTLGRIALGKIENLFSTPYFQHFTT
jgi:hypothetical protein